MPSPLVITQSSLNAILLLISKAGSVFAHSIISESSNFNCSSLVLAFEYCSRTDAKSFDNAAASLRSRNRPIPLRLADCICSWVKSIWLVNLLYKLSYMKLRSPIVRSVPSMVS